MNKKFYVNEYPAAAGVLLAVPTPATSLPTTPVFDTRLVSDIEELVVVLYP